MKNIELRWYNVGTYPDRVAVLQYRTLDDKDWSEWIDVPTVEGPSDE